MLSVILFLHALLQYMRGGGPVPNRAAVPTWAPE